MERNVTDYSHREVYRYSIDADHLGSAEERYRIAMASQ